MGRFRLYAIVFVLGNVTNVAIELAFPGWSPGSMIMYTASAFGRAEVPEPPAVPVPAFESDKAWKAGPPLLPGYPGIPGDGQGFIPEVIPPMTDQELDSYMKDLDERVNKLIRELDAADNPCSAKPRKRSPVLETSPFICA